MLCILLSFGNLILTTKYSSEFCFALCLCAALSSSILDVCLKVRCPQLTDCTICLTSKSNCLFQILILSLFTKLNKALLCSYICFHSLKPAHNMTFLLYLLVVFFYIEFIDEKSSCFVRINLPYIFHCYIPRIFSRMFFRKVHNKVHYSAPVSLRSFGVAYRTHEVIFLLLYLLHYRLFLLHWLK